MKNLAWIALSLAACAQQPGDGALPCTGKCDGDGSGSGSDAIAWSRPTRCTAAVIDDARTALLCDGATMTNDPMTLEVVDTATGETQWSKSFPSGLGEQMFVHGDELWFYLTDVASSAYRRSVFAASDGSVRQDGTVGVSPVDIVWDAAGNSWEVAKNNPLDSQPNWVALTTYDPDHNQRWGVDAFAQQSFGIQRVLAGADGNFYFAAHEELQAVPADHNATRTGVLWATSCTNTVSDLVLRHDGSPLVRCGSAYTLYPTAGVVDIYGKKPSIALHAYADKIREANGGTMLVATGTNTVALFTYDGAPVASMAPSNDVASDGFRGPEFGLKPTAGETGALVQTPSGVALYDYSSHALAWTQARFFLPLAVGTSGFVGVCSRPPVANGAPLDDHLELCLLRETGETAWQVAVPWQNYGVAARKLDGSASIFQASGHYVEAAAAHRWIVSNTQGTFAIATP